MSRILTPNLNYEKMKSDICIWLVTTDHLEDTLWFREEEDFKVGMNYVAVLVAGMPVFIVDYVENLFRTPSFEEINDEQKKEVLRQLRYRFSSNVFQLARVVGLSYEAAARLMDSQ